MNKKSMSVPEMRRILGLGKTDSYWLVKKHYFETIIVGRKMRVLVDSFEEWYVNQLHYKKVDGTPPGQKWTAITYSIQEAAILLGITDSSVYDLLKKELFRTVKVGQCTRIYKDSFTEWFNLQNYYPLGNVHKEETKCLKNELQK